MKRIFSLALILCLSQVTMAAKPFWRGLFGNNQNSSYIAIAPDFEKIGMPYYLDVHDWPGLLSGHVAFFFSQANLKTHKSTKPIHLVAVDITRHGQVLWQKDLFNDVFFPTARDENSLENVEANQDRTEFEVVLRQVDTGKVVTQSKLADITNPSDKNEGVLFTAGDITYVMFIKDDEDNEAVSPGLSQIMAYDHLSEKVLWSRDYELSDPDIFPALSDKSIFLLSVNSAYKINGLTGHVDKKLNIQECERGPGFCLPVVIDDNRILYVRDFGELYIADFNKEQSELWLSDIKDGKLIVDKETIYLIRNHYLEAYDKQSLSLKWQHQVQPSTEPFAVTDNAIILMDEDKGIILLNKDGQSLPVFGDFSACNLPIALNEKALICVDMWNGMKTIVYPFLSTMSA